MEDGLSKRSVLKRIASIYDPLGLAAPISVSFKMFFQKLCESKCNWDDELNEELKAEWVKLIPLLSNDVIFKVDRYYFGSYSLREVRCITLHGFRDASAKAYAAVIYIAGQTANKWISNIIVRKTKVSPLQKVSIPRLELCACLLLSTLLANVQRVLQGVVDVDSVVCWSDSLDALFWIKDENKRRNVFVENRVQKIRKNVAPANWRFCPTELNPADLPSRGVQNVKKLENEYLKWKSGPEFIRQNKDQWPPDRSCENENTGSEVEFADNSEGTNIMVVANDCGKSNRDETVCLYVSDDVTNRKKTMQHNFNDGGDIKEIIDISKYSSLRKLFRVTAKIVRFIWNLKRVVKGETLTRSRSDEIEQAERLWVKSTQRCLSNKSKQLNNTLGLYVNDQGVIDLI